MRSKKPALLPRKAMKYLLPRRVIKKLRWLGAAGAVLTALIALVVWFAWPPSSTRNVLQEAGYYEIIPPSKLHGPGTINTVEFLDNGKVQLQPTCETDQVSDLLVSKIRESDTTDRELLQSLKKRLDISEKIKDLFASEAAISETKSIFLSFQNAHILSISDQVMLSVRQALLTNHCDEAIEWNISHGGMVCQASSVLEADVTYEIKYNDNVSAADQIRFSSEAAAKLDLAASADSTNRISGKRLFYGIRLAPDAIILNTPDAKPTKCLRF